MTEKRASRFRAPRRQGSRCRRASGQVVRTKAVTRVFPDRLDQVVEAAKHLVGMRAVRSGESGAVVEIAG